MEFDKSKDIMWGFHIEKGIKSIRMFKKISDNWYSVHYKTKNGEIWALDYSYTFHQITVNYVPSLCEEFAKEVA